jgi:hypothetical protein
MGNVSHVVPSIHARFAICSGANIHSLEFEKEAATDHAHAETMRVSIYNAILMTS